MTGRRNIARRLREYLAFLAEEYRLGLVFRLVAFLIGIWIVGATWLYVCERNWVPTAEQIAAGERNWFSSYHESFRHILVYLFSGFEQYEPHTFLGWFGSIIVMLFGSLGVLALLIGNVSAIVQERVRRAGYVRRKPRGAALSKHVVLCNWNRKGPGVVRALRARQGSESLAIAIVAPEASHIPIEDKRQYRRIWAVDGDPRDASALQQADVAQAEAAIVLADEGTGAGREESPAAGRTLRFEDSVDGRSALVAKSIEVINARVHTVVDLLDRKNKARFATEAVDEMIAVGEFAKRYLARAAQIHGIAAVYSSLLGSQPGASYVEIIEITPNLIGRSYESVRRSILNLDLDAILLGYKAIGEVLDPVLVINPPLSERTKSPFSRDYRLRQFDQLVVLCRDGVPLRDVLAKL